MRVAIVACVLFVGTSAARADRVSPEDLARKHERGYVTGLPLAAYSTDIGYGGGARVYYYWNGERTDSRFAATPYLHRVFLQGFVTTRGIQFHWLDYDAPRIFRSPYRIRSQLIYGRNINQNYFGVGDDALAPLAFPGAPGSYDDYGAYTADQRRVTGGMAWTKYDQLDLTRALWLVSAERLFWDDRIRVLAGVGLSTSRIDDYTGEEVDAVDAGGAPTRATMATTRLRADCDAGRIEGCGGGRDNIVRFGISYDTRDFEPDPNCGVFADLAIDVGTVALGGQYDYVRGLVAVRGYWSPTARADLVLAARALLEAQTAGTPFFAMNTLPFTEDPRAGLGGHRTLRGFRQDRFVGPVMAALTGEARWTFARTTVWNQRLGFILVPFVDAGRPFDALAELSVRRWRLAYGGALRVSWNLATIITVDYGRSSEDAGLYINFGHIF
jgi:hypothetical protein